MKNKLSSEARKRQSRVIGLFTIISLAILTVLVMLIQYIEKQKSKIGYAHTRYAISKTIDGENANCTELLGDSRKLIKRALRKPKARDFLINRKAVVYDLAIQKAQALCEGQPPPSIINIDTPCTSPEVCAEQAWAFMLNGRYLQSAGACEEGMRFKNEKILKELRDLALRLEIETDKKTVD